MFPLPAISPLTPPLATVTFLGGTWTWVAWGLVAVALFLLAFSYIRSPLRGPRRIVAVLLKALGIALLALVLAEPARLDSVPKIQANDVAILADNSAGLGVSLGDDQPPPSETLRSALLGRADDAAPAWMTAIAKTFRVQSYLVDRGLHPVSDFQTLDFSRPHSALGGALAQLATRYQGSPLAAVVLLTDGNATDASTLDAFEADQRSRPPDFRTPVFPVVVGQMGSDARDLILTRADAVTTQFEDAQVTVDVVAEALGAFPHPVEVYVSNDKNEELAKKSVRFPDGTERRQVSTRLRLSGLPPGVSFLTVGIRQIEPATGATDGASIYPQLTERNDQITVAVNRGRGPYRILYVGGRPNWEFKFLRRAIAEDAEIDLVALIRIAKREPKFEWRGRPGESGNPLFRGYNRDLPEETQRYDEPVLIRLNTASPEELRDGFPKTAEELFPHYRAIILDDVEADFFSAEQQDLIERFVSLRGGTLMMLGGQESFQLGGWDKTAVGRVLPVYLDRNDPATPALDARYDLSREGWLEDWLRLRSERREEEIRLGHMPTFFSINRLPTPKPGAVVLATVTDSEDREWPALITQRYGEGRSAALAIGDLWRWGLKDADLMAEQNKAWRQLLRWAVVDVSSRLELTQEFADEGSLPTTRVAARVRDANFDPQDDVTVTMTVHDLDGSTQEITGVPSLDESGLFTAEHLTEESRGYRIAVRAIDGGGQEIGTGELARALNLEAAEFARLGPDRELLQNIAEATGGTVLSLDSLDQLPSLLEQIDLPAVDIRQRPLWHSPWLFLLALACFLGEWTLRRSSGTL